MGKFCNKNDIAATKLMKIEVFATFLIWSEFAIVCNSWKFVYNRTKRSVVFCLILRYNS